MNGYARTQRSWGWELAINYADGEERGRYRHIHTTGAYNFDVQLGIVSTADVAFDDFVIPEQAYSAFSDLLGF